MMSVDDDVKPAEKGGDKAQGREKPTTETFLKQWCIYYEEKKEVYEVFIYLNFLASYSIPLLNILLISS